MPPIQPASRPAAGCDPYGDMPAKDATLEQCEPINSCTGSWRPVAACQHGCLQAVPDMLTASLVTTHQLACAVWQCRLAGLPDLNYTRPEVREEAANWLNWMIGQFGWVGGWGVCDAVRGSCIKAGLLPVLPFNGWSMLCLLSTLAAARICCALMPPATCRPTCGPGCSTAPRSR